MDELKRKWKTNNYRKPPNVSQRDWIRWKREAQKEIYDFEKNYYQKELEQNEREPSLKTCVCERLP